MSLPKTLIWLDLETTGLDPIRHTILECAAFKANFSAPFNLGEPNVRWIKRLQDWTNVSEHVVGMHQKSGLIGDCVAAPVGDSTTAKLEKTLVETFGQFIHPDEQDKLVLAGSSVHFDLGFLREHCPKFAAMLSHRVFDVSALRLACYSLGMPEDPKSYPVHRAVEDVLASRDLGQRCVAWLREKYGDERELELRRTNQIITPVDPGVGA